MFCVLMDPWRVCTGKVSTFSPLSDTFSHSVESRVGRGRWELMTKEASTFSGQEVTGVGEVRNGSDIGARTGRSLVARDQWACLKGFWVPKIPSAPSPVLLLIHQWWGPTVWRKEGTLESSFAQISESLECRSGPWSCFCDENFLPNPDQSPS